VYFNIDNFDSVETETTPVDDLGILIESFDSTTKEKVWREINNFVVKPSVNTHYSDGILKGTSVHRIIENGIEIPLIEHKDFKEFLEPMEVVDLSVDGTECYYANGRLNHNTTPGGKALKFAASVRIKLLGKTPVVEPDPFAEAAYQKSIEEFNVIRAEWKANGSLGEKPEKPKKEKGDDIIIAYDVVARTEKNKVGPPKRDAEFRIVFSQGIVEEDAWFDYSLKYNIIKKVSGFEYEFVKYPQLGLFKRSGWKEMLSDVELHEEVKKTITSKLVRSLETEALVPLVEAENEEEVEDDAITEA